MVAERGYFIPPVEVDKEQYTQIVDDAVYGFTEHDVRKRTLPVGTHIVTPISARFSQKCEVYVRSDGTWQFINTFRNGHVHEDGSQTLILDVPKDTKLVVLKEDCEDPSREIVHGYLAYFPGESPLE